ncbi:MAG TPA: hypothetical protein VM537_02065 [Anaerolineae bacterium]|nr:hypothetical protein [Anaerolineae bacterium]
MQIREVVSEMTPRELAQAVGGFRKTYVSDWEEWLNAPASDEVSKFGGILRKWQATRPYPLRRTRQEADHEAPFLDDLVEWAQPHLAAVEGITLASIHGIQPPQCNAMDELWSIFKQLPATHSASCVGISKATLLLTNGRIGPAFDGNVRKRLGIDYIETPAEWIAVLAQIGSDVRSFEQKWRVPISEAVPPQFRYLEMGRLYDMVLGPRESATLPPDEV